MTEFVRVCREFWARNPERDIAVHCHYGFNRTGFLIAACLVLEGGMHVRAAVEAFAQSRPPGIKHLDFVDELNLRFDASSQQEGRK